MGICASSSSSLIHDDNFGHENAVYHTEITTSNTNNGSQRRIGSTYSHTGSKGLNQDTAILFQGYGNEKGVYCGIYDGHGQNGHVVSKMVRNRLPALILSQMTEKFGSGDQSGLSIINLVKWKEACMSSFKVVDKEIKLVDGLDCSCSGSTAVVVIKQGEDLVVANLGDSRAVLGTRSEDGIMAVQLTTDLKPGVKSEAERIRRLNGRVVALEAEPHIQRVWLPYENSPGLAMSRAFGDFVLKNHGIICIPDVTYHRLTPNDEFIVLASDGVWDVMSNNEVMGVVSSSAHNEEAAAKAVVDAAIASWKHKFPNSKRDDCTAICLFLQ
ncbi:hypothetical protein ABFS82_01G015200 [Erythranthe guttata]|nr:PREDICTED: probable protein phosphatase 2C 72 [Erythranthe guttata]|eukprot:XP_012857980.1 PREDICTED: probable protein phosphatase 2C 72 [Erythranthe guttata]